MKKLIILIIPILLLCGCTMRSGYNYYEYKDLEGNIGTAETCFEDNGGLFCRLSDGTLLQVHSFKFISSN